MNKLIVALIAATFATVAAAQSQPMTKKEINAEKAKTVDSVTKSETDTSSGLNAAKGSAAAAKEKGTPKALPTKADKRKAVDSATTAGAGSSASGLDAAKGSAMAKEQKNTPKALPTKADKRKAVDSATAEGAKSH
jgi:hypothetical protein